MGYSVRVYALSDTLYLLYVPAWRIKPENYFTMSYMLSEDGEGTLLTIEKNDNRPGPDKSAEENPD